MSRVNGLFQDSSGNAVGLATVNVYSPGTTTPIAIWSDAALSVAKANPFTSNADGSWSFYVGGGIIRIVVSKTGYTTSDNDDVEILDRSEMALLAGRAGGTTLDGSPTTGESLVLRSNPLANGKVTVLPFTIDQANLRVGLGTTAPAVDFEIKSDRPRLRFNDDDGTVFQLASNNNEFFLADITNASKVPLRIAANAATATVSINSDGVGIGDYPSSASARFEIVSTTQGFLPPRMTTAQRDAIATPAAGLTIFNSTTGKLEVWDGALWQACF